MGGKLYRYNLAQFMKKLGYADALATYASSSSVAMAVAVGAT
jgi:hypothetical protein